MSLAAEDADSILSATLEAENFGKDNGALCLHVLSLSREASEWNLPPAFKTAARKLRDNTLATLIACFGVDGTISNVQLCILRGLRVKRDAQQWLERERCVYAVSNCWGISVDDALLRVMDLLEMDGNVSVSFVKRPGPAFR